MPIPESDRRQLSFIRGFGYAVTGILVAALLVGVAFALVNDDVPLALVFVGTAAFFLIPTYMTSVKSRFRPRATIGAEGVEFRPDRRVDAYSVAMMAVGVLTFGTWGVLGFLGTVGFPYATPDHVSDRWPFLVSFGIMAGFCAWCLLLVARYRGIAFLRFGPEGYAAAEGFFSFHGEWSQVTAVTDQPPTYRRPFTKTPVHRTNAWCPITLTLADGTTAGIPDATLYTADGDALRDWVQFYWQHPEHRDELADERSLARLRG